MKLEAQYLKILAKLGEQPGTLGVVFKKAQNKIQDPAKLRRLIFDLIGTENWMSLGVDVKGDAYEGLLAKNAEDVKTGAGQYFTPRVLIAAIVEVMRPKPDQRICDPAAGTGGFLLAAFNYIVQYHNAEMDEDQKKFLRDEALQGWEIVAVTARLCLMNLMLHGITRPDGDPPIHVEDALGRSIDDKFQMVLTNPPFGRKVDRSPSSARTATEIRTRTSPICGTTSGRRRRTSSSTTSSMSTRSWTRTGPRQW